MPNLTGVCTCASREGRQAISGSISSRAGVPFLAGLRGQAVSRNAIADFLTSQEKGW